MGLDAKNSQEKSHKIWKEYFLKAFTSIPWVALVQVSIRHDQKYLLENLSIQIPNFLQDWTEKKSSQAYVRKISYT